MLFLCLQLEGNLAERERQVLERRLLLDQVTRLSEPLSERVESCQQDRLALAKEVDDIWMQNMLSSCSARQISSQIHAHKLEEHVPSM